MQRGKLVGLTVDPKIGKDGFEQPKFSRGAVTVATSPVLLAYRACMRRELLGKKYPAGRPDVIKGFTAIAPKCAAEAKARK